MFEDKIEAMNKLPNAVDDSSGFEKRVYTVEEILSAMPEGFLFVQATSEADNKGIPHRRAYLYRKSRQPVG